MERQSSAEAQTVVTPLRAPKPLGGPRGVLRSFRHAWEGLLLAMNQRNMKVHVVSGVLVGLVGSGIRLELAEKVTLIFCVMLVFFAEILNTALEALVDLHTEDYRENARKAKDAAAAAVMVLAAGTVVIFAALLVHNWHTIAASGPQIARQALVGGPLAALVAAMLAGPRRASWFGHLAFVLALGLWGLLWSWTTSSVFTTLTGLLVFASWRAGQRKPAP